MLLSEVHTKSESSSCVTNENREDERKVQTLLTVSHLHTGQSLHKVVVNVEFAVKKARKVTSMKFFLFSP